MKRILFLPMLAIGLALAYCPDCDIAANTTFTFEPSIINVWSPRSRLVIGQFHHKTYSGSYMAKELFVPQDTKVDYVQFTKNGGCE